MPSIIIMASKQAKTNHHQHQDYRVFVGGLSVNCEEKELRQYLLHFGPLSHCSINRDHAGISKGYAFASFKCQKDQMRSIGKQHVLQGKPFEIRVLVDSDRNVKLLNEFAKRKVFISNLKDNITEADISEQFCKFGAIEEILISKEPATQQSKGFGFVVFKSTESLSKVLNGRQKRIVKVNSHDVIVRAAIPKKDIECFKKDHQPENEQAISDNNNEPEDEHKSDQHKYISNSNKSKSQNQYKPCSDKLNHNNSTKRQTSSKATNLYLEKYLDIDGPQQPNNYTTDGCCIAENRVAEHEEGSLIKRCTKVNHDNSRSPQQLSENIGDSVSSAQEQQFYTRVNEHLASNNKKEGQMLFTHAPRELSVQGSNISFLDSLKQSPMMTASRRLADGVQGYCIRRVARKDSANYSLVPRKIDMQVQRIRSEIAPIAMPESTKAFIPKNICLCGIDSLQNKENSNFVHFLNSKRCVCKPDPSSSSKGSNWVGDNGGYETQDTSRYHSYADLSNSRPYSSFGFARPEANVSLRNQEHNPFQGTSMNIGMNDLFTGFTQKWQQTTHGDYEFPSLATTYDDGYDDHYY